MSIKLRRFTTTDEKEGKYTVVLPGSVNSDLALYRDAYRTAYGEDAPNPEKIIVGIVAQFLSSDSAFQALKRQQIAGETPRRTRARKADPAASPQATQQS
jgi:hypothetical protein